MKTLLTVFTLIASFAANAADSNYACKNADASIKISNEYLEIARVTQPYNRVQLDVYINSTFNNEPVAGEVLVFNSTNQKRAEFEIKAISRKKILVQTDGCDSSKQVNVAFTSSSFKINGVLNVEGSKAKKLQLTCVETVFSSSVDCEDKE